MKSPFKTMNCSVFQLCFTLSPTWGGTSPIHHPRGRHQGHKATKNTTKIIRFGITTSFMGKKNSPLKTITCKVFLIYPTL